MSTATELDTGPLKFGDHVGHRDRGTWIDNVPGRVVAVDTTREPPRVRVHPTMYNNSLEWEADADDLVRLGKGCRCGCGSYALGDEVSSASAEPVEAVAPNGSVHRVIVPPSMVVDVYQPYPYRHRCRVRTADGTLWDVANRDLSYVTPRQ